MLSRCAGACAKTCTSIHRLVAQASEQGTKKSTKKEKKKKSRKKYTFYFHLRSGCTCPSYNCPGGTHHKPAMTRGRGGACVMRSVAVRGGRSLPASENVGTHVPVLPLFGLPVAALVYEAGLSCQRVPLLVEPQRLVAFVLPACRGR